jgi:hypothetical protein
MNLSIFTVFVLCSFFTFCKNHKKVESNISDVTIEQTTRMLDSLKKNNKSSEIEHLIISTDSSIFNKEEADLCLEYLIKVLTEKKIIMNDMSNHMSVIIDSYDATDSCYVYCVSVQAEDQNLESDIIGWWKFFPRTKKVVNGITFEVIN